MLIEEGRNDNASGHAKVNRVIVGQIKGVGVIATTSIEKQQQSSGRGEIFDVDGGPFECLQRLCADRVTRLSLEEYFKVRSMRRAHAGPCFKGNCFSLGGGLFEQYLPDSILISLDNVV